MSRGEPYLKSNSGRDPTESVWSLQGALDYSRQFGGHDVGATLVYHMKETKKVKDGGAEKIFFLTVSKGWPDV